MEIFGIGGAELAAILIIMLIVAGPKRMIQWAYVLGQYTAKARSMWSDVMDNVQREIDAVGVDVKLPKTMPTRTSFVNPVNNVWANITAPVQDAMNDIRTEMNQTQTELRDTMQTVQEEKVAS